MVAQNGRQQMALT